MKKLLILLLSILLVAGCATFDQKTLSTTDLERLAEGAEAASKVRAYHSLTGGGSGALDKTTVGSLTDGDIGFVVTEDGYLNIYHFKAAATDAEESPFLIRPDDYSTAGVHYLINAIYLKPHATPGVSFRDADNTDFDISGGMSLDCTDTGSGTEDCDLTFSVMEGGVYTEKITIDGDGNILFHDDFRTTYHVELADNGAIEIDAAENGMNDDEYSGYTFSGRTCGETLLQWDLVVIKNDVDEFHKADANLPGEFPAQGLSVAACTDSGGVEVMTQGVVRNDGWTLTAGQPIYLGTNPGEITVTAPAASGDCVQIVGWALDDDHIYFDFSRPYLEVE